MAPNHVAKNGTTESRAVIAGPHLGTIKVGHQYICEYHIRRMFVEKRLDAAREANYRLQGVQVIESTREALLLPVKTYNAACTFYHRFRLEHPTPDYNYTDAALASLFVACKVEDTLKKSREVLCAHHNLKNPDHPTTQDDKIFDQPSKVIIGIERYMVEAINFDFRVRYPQKILAKIAKKVIGKSADLTSFFPTAMKMSIDLYKTYAPLKHSSYTCALVIAQLTAMITGRFVDEFQALDPLDWHTDEQCVVEVMLDLLDLYTQHGKVTKVGPIFDLQVFIDTQISINQFVERTGLSRYLNQCRDCESIALPPTPSTGSPMSLSTPSAAGTSTVKRGSKGPDGGTTRFVFDADEAVREKKVYDEHTKDEWEEWEEEIEEPIPDSREDRRHEPRGPRGPRGHGHGPGHGRGHGRGGFDPGWTPRNRHDRRRRGGGFY
ncbi:cyclin-like protein [Daldinia grandis]|nr:cyclin-like protein [Daldinia grandis]